MNRFFMSAVLFVATLLPYSAHAESIEPEGISDAFAESRPVERFPWLVKPDSLTVSLGDTFTVTATLGVPPHHHIYAERTDVSIEAAVGFSVGNVRRPEPTLKYDNFEKRDVPQYDSDAEFTIPIVVGAELVGQVAGITIVMRTQGCSETVCFFPTETRRVVTINVRPATGSAALIDYSADGIESNAPSSSVRSMDLGRVLGDSGIIVALGLMFVGGILTSFTPCVYPLIPLTVSFFGASGAGAFRGFLLSVFFVLGMAAMYSILGVSAAASGAVFGSVMSNPIVMGIVAAIFVAFSLSMFGAFKITLSSSFMSRLMGIGGVGFGGAFLAGTVAGIIAAPCTGPVLGSALAYVASTGDLAFGFASMFAFALGMGLLFIAIGTFSTRIVPNRGPWLKMVESVFGIAMMVAALYFLKDAVTALSSVFAWSHEQLGGAIVLMVAGLGVGAVHLRFVSDLDTQGNPEPNPTLSERARKTIGIAMMVAGGFGIISVVSPGATVATDHAEPDWVYDVSEGLARAAAEDKPVLIDAYADWCVECTELDIHTYADERVLDRLEDFVSIKLDFTDTNDETRRLQRDYRIVGLPTVIVLSSDGTEYEDRRILGFVLPDQLLTTLEGIQ
jgi:thioredoxin:protein disulfide reductase